MILQPFQCSNISVISQPPSKQAACSANEQDASSASSRMRRMGRWHSGLEAASLQQPLTLSSTSPESWAAVL